MLHILALLGPQQAGKSEAAKAIAELPNWKRLSFADPLYDIMSVILGVDARLLDKSAPQPILGGKTLRQALQTLGTEWGRDLITPYIWANVMRNRIEQQRMRRLNIVIDDLRFANEHDMLRELGAKVVRVTRPGTGPIGTHGSEVEWQWLETDVTCDNLGDQDNWRSTMQYLARRL